MVELFFKNLFKNIDDGSQTIVIDPKRTFYAGNKQRILVFRPLDLQEFILVTSELNKYLSSRLSTIVVLDFPYFFRDFRGKSAKNVVINHRAFSACVSILEKIANENIFVTCEIYENPLKINYPLFHKIIKYYGYESFKIKEIEDEFLILRQENGSIIKIKI
ncbi:MAG: hypothetical protein HeimC2_09240 [Candidatus Heimdallarchaeota archaeon LC_2]|nr:MAG: hypothetical protein HeimC2_09240 [Candidatus Heimdallarchaeota archaeon LC_2]